MRQQQLTVLLDNRYPLAEAKRRFGIKRFVACGKNKHKIIMEIT